MERASPQVGHGQQASNPRCRPRPDGSQRHLERDLELRDAVAVGAPQGQAAGPASAQWVAMAPRDGARRGVGDSGAVRAEQAAVDVLKGRRVRGRGAVDERAGRRGREGTKWLATVEGGRHLARSWERLGCGERDDKRALRWPRCEEA